MTQTAFILALYIAIVSFSTAIPTPQRMLASNVIMSHPLGVDFITWANTHNKIYTGHNETEIRFVTYVENRAFIAGHNVEASIGEQSYTMAVNAFADMTNEQFLALQDFRATSLKNFSEKESPQALLNETVPGSWDLRDQGIITPAKNQGECGSCWSFSTVAAIEAIVNKAHKGKDLPAACKSAAVMCSGTTPCCSLSEQEVIDCTDGSEYQGGKITCQTGGQPIDGVLAIVNGDDGKINTDNDYAYTSGTDGRTPGVCRSNFAFLKNKGVSTGIKGYARIPQGDEDAMKAACYTHGVINIAIDARRPSLRFYSKGVYNEPECKAGREDLSHAVAIIGQVETCH